MLYGESLGSGVAVRLATEQPVAGLILDAPFTSAADVAGHHYWYLPVWLLRDQYRSIDRIHELKSPLLVIHGDRDGVIPIALGERLFAAAPGPKRFVTLPGVDHVSVLESGGLGPVRAFLDAIERTALVSGPRVRVRTALAARSRGDRRAHPRPQHPRGGDHRRPPRHACGRGRLLSGAASTGSPGRRGASSSAEAEAAVVGMLGLIVQEDQVFVRADVRRHGYVCDLVVDEAWRGQGRRAPARSARPSA